MIIDDAAVVNLQGIVELTSLKVLFSRPNIVIYILPPCGMSTEQLTLKVHVTLGEFTTCDEDFTSNSIVCADVYFS